jgi:hypothetical protein
MGAGAPCPAGAQRTAPLPVLLLSTGYAGAAPCTRSGGPALLNLPLGAGALPPDPLAMITSGVENDRQAHAQGLKS